MGLSPGDRVDRYEVIDLLGSGGMGEVYRARDPRLERLVALKILRVEQSTGTDGGARLLREARAAAALSHANVLAVFDVGEVQEPPELRGLAYIAMELVLGRSLRAYVGDEGVSLDRRVSWLRDVARALGAAHEAGIVHRDVKPENVMIRFDGAVKVLDFGIARRTTAPYDAWSSIEGHSLATAETGPSNASPATTTGSLAGTPLYMAPEQLRGETLDGRTDQFAWGVMAYELLTGRPPWVGKGLSEPVALFSQILSFEPRSPSEIDPRVPVSISNTIVRSLAKQRDARFGSMEQLSESLGSDHSQAAAVSAPMVPAGSEAVGRASWHQRLRLPFFGFASVAALLVTAFVTLKHKPEATPVVEVASQMSTNPEATAAYRAGVQAFRDASLGPAIKQLQHAVELDPLFAAASLRLATAKVVFGLSITSADLQGARDSRASLNAPDRALLEALEPWMLERGDIKESDRRLAAAARQYPTDTDLTFNRSVLLGISGQTAEAVENLDRLIAKDPNLAVALLEKAELLLDLGDVSGAFGVYARCIEVSPGTTTCVDNVAAVQANEGKCQELVATSRRLIQLAPTHAQPYMRLAEGLVGTDQPHDVVRAAIQQATAQLKQDGAGLELATDAAMAILDGDFPAAMKIYQRLEKVDASDFNEEKRFRLAYVQMLVELETGHAAKASERAARYLRERTAWSGSIHDNSLAAYTVQRAAGSLDATAFEELRARWIAQNETEQPAFRWITGFARTVETSAEAHDALTKRPSGTIVSSRYMTPDFAEPIGRTYLLAGEDDEAIRYLTAASNSCNVLDGSAALFSTWAAFDLGQALEARGDTAGACAAYARVIGRWGSTTPPTRTVARTRERRTALGCAR